VNGYLNDPNRTGAMGRPDGNSAGLLKSQASMGGECTLTDEASTVPTCLLSSCRMTHFAVNLGYTGRPSLGYSMDGRRPEPPPHTRFLRQSSHRHPASLASIQGANSGRNGFTLWVYRRRNVLRPPEAHRTDPHLRRTQPPQKTIVIPI